MNPTLIHLARPALMLALLTALGCAGTEGDQNYRVLEEDKQMLDAEDEVPVGMMPPAAMFTATMQTQEEQAEAAESQDAQPATEAVTPAAAATEAVTPAEEPGAEAGAEAVTPSQANVLDRSNWQRITVSPNDAAVWHSPVYYRDDRLHDNYVNVLAQPTTQMQLYGALDGAEARNLGLDSLDELFVQPLKFAADTVLLVPRAVVTLPIARVSTPPQPDQARGLLGPSQ